MTSRIDVPNIETIFKIIDELYEFSRRKSKLELDIKIKESEINTKATNLEQYFVGGKPPSQTYIDNTWKYPGFDGELIPLRVELIEVSVELEKRKFLFDAYKLWVDLYRTESANERTSFV